MKGMTLNCLKKAYSTLKTAIYDNMNQTKTKNSYPSLKDKSFFPFKSCLLY